MKRKLPKFKIEQTRYKIVKTLFGSFIPTVIEDNLTYDEAKIKCQAYDCGDPYEMFEIHKM